MSDDTTSVLEMTKAFIACRACPDSFHNGSVARGKPSDGILRRVPDGAGGHYWIPPRGWSGSESAGHRAIVVAALNPGAPHPGEGADLRRNGVELSADGTASTAAARAILDNGTRQFVQLGRGGHYIFHRNTLAYVRMAMWLLRDADTSYGDLDPLAADWRDYAWITDAFKCSTLFESGPRIPASHLTACVQLHLTREVDAFEPKVVLALGGGAERALTLAGVAHVPLRHPSNGCPRAEDPRHDAQLARVAAALGHREPEKAASSAAFREFRKRLRERLYASE
ncbi:MAG: hypothetical protein IT299_10420 [Dehalococcoidia bacterium]|nr:hypothetical protein [Dehalococcoidia bacterium]